MNNEVHKVNEQLRAGGGEKPNFDMNSMAMKQATNAPKLDVINEQVRGPSPRAANP